MPYSFMLSEKMDRLAGIMQTTEFIYRVLPYLALGIIIAFAVIMFFRSRAKSKIEENAGPDLSLRLASASSIIYAAMLLVLFFSQGLLMFYALFMKDPEFTINAVSDPVKEAFSLLPFMLAILTCVFAVWQIAVSRWLLKGNIAARNILIGLWLWNFFMLSFPLVSCRAYGLIGLGAGLWTLWVIAIRKDASGKIAKGLKNLSLSKKTVLIFAVILAISAGVTGQLMTFSVKPDFSKTVSSFGTSSSEGITARLDELYIMTGSDDELTRMTADLLSEKITEKTGIPCKVVSSVDAPLKVNMDRAAVLYMEYGKVITPSCPIPKFLKNKIPPSQAESAGKTGFKLKFLHSFETCFFPVKGLVFPQIELNFSGSVSADAGSDAAIAQQSAGEIMKKLLPSLEKHRSCDSVDIPEIKLPAQEFPPLLKLKGLKDIKLIFLGEGINQARLEVYSFKKVNYDSDLAIITEELKKRGFDQRAQNAYAGQLVFNADMHNALLDMGYRNGDPVPLSLDIDPEHGLLIVPVYREESYDASPEFLNEIMKKDLRLFVLSRGLSTIDPKLRLNAMRDFFALDDLSFQARLSALQSLSHEKLTPEEKAVYEKAFLKMIDETAEQENFQDLLKRMQDLKSISDITPDAKPLIEQLHKKLSDVFIEIKMPDTPDKEGLVRKSLEFPVGNLHSFRKMIEISFETPGYVPIWLPFGIVKTKENLQIIVGNMTNSSPPADINKSVYYSQWNTAYPDSPTRRILIPCMCGSKNSQQDKSSEKLQGKNELLTELSFDAKKKCVRLSVVFRPQKNSQKK